MSRNIVIVALVALSLSSGTAYAATSGAAEPPQDTERSSGLIEAYLWRTSMDALDAYNRGDYKGAYIRWLELAERGDPYAEKNLGLMYYYGHGVAQDFAKAASWYKRAAERGHPNAQNNLSIMYALGQGVDRDLVEALKWAGLAAGQGFEKSVSLINYLTANMPAEEIKAARQMIRAWQPRPRLAEPKRCQVLGPSACRYGERSP